MMTEYSIILMIPLNIHLALILLQLINIYIIAAQPPRDGLGLAKLAWPGLSLRGRGSFPLGAQPLAKPFFLRGERPQNERGDSRNLLPRRSWWGKSWQRNRLCLCTCLPEMVCRTSL